MRSDEAIGAASVGTSDAVEVGELFAVNTFAPLSVLFSFENMRSHYGYLLVEISGLLRFSSTKNSQVFDQIRAKLQMVGKRSRLGVGTAFAMHCLIQLEGGHDCCVETGGNQIEIPFLRCK